MNQTKDSNAEIYGFAILRNGVKYDYPFNECLESMNGVCLKTYLALGQSDDGTAEALKNKDSLKILETIWDDNLRSGGLILSQQTNLALQFLQEDHGDKTNSWGLYLQCDEVIHERDYELLKDDFNKAQEQGCDAISFRYMHFWQSHTRIAINKKWYPQEIRAVKLNSKAQSWGDAQSFENVDKVYQSEVVVYHYGHVREEEKYKNKKSDILKFYHSDEKMKKYKKREKKFDNQTECLQFLGRHPLVMKKRIEASGENWDKVSFDEVYILGNIDHLDPKMISNINSKQVHFVKSVFEVPITHRNSMVLLEPNLFQKVWYGLKTPKKMRSKLALPWSDNFHFSMLCYEKDISIN